ncbi:Periplasmic pH-dependent serine endoprotease DegQ precursor [Lacunisphaera limnophila]|uniref:Periplasmic pH-dependent serine endoprotease DegQ n=1 Tax=Lacunisphaera limnophila TaxID=1838286 RepID=A0A1D8AZT3_9BACT|nr:Do family serine endopeptidase [Lacunisphaera limnophila]AOS46377.1 Periplasmic pH-dependent serine endoprotease DegQ precursor [Lacunisphaera limnophila]
MKIPKVVFASFLVSALAGLSLGLIAADKKTTPATKPDLKVDSSPVSAGKSPVVTSYADILDSIRPAVVSVYSSKTVRQQVPEFFRRQGIQGREQKQRGMGSGVLVSADGYILTNNHVVEGADELKVLFTDEREFTAKIIGTDPKTDVAIIKIEGENLPSATLADSDNLRVGDVVFAIGNPLDVGQTVTMGIVSATSRRVGILDDVAGYEDFIQTDAAINQGNSGGALIDARGRLIGINSAILSTSQGNIGIGFAIPINLASSIMHSLIETGTVARGYMGVETDVLTAEMAESFGVSKDTKGLLITNLPPGGPASKSDLKREDIITSINGKSVSTRDDLRLRIAQIPPGTTVTVDYIRNGKPGQTEVTLAQRPDDNARFGELLPGVKADPLTDELRQQNRIDGRVDGLIITEIAEDSPYAESLRVGMVIEQINRTPVTDAAVARAVLVNGRNIALVHYRGVYRYVIFYIR